ncbi:MAG TPA: hypothetical protein PLD15_04015 [Mesotoga sp.]|nr:hypothetical protein [Mesotoga sp.]
MDRDLFLDSSRFDFVSTTDYSYISEKGFDEELIRQISTKKDEPEWMLRKRLESFEIFNRSLEPGFGVGTGDLDLQHSSLSQARFRAKPFLGGSAQGDKRNLRKARYP